MFFKFNIFFFLTLLASTATGEQKEKYQLKFGVVPQFEVTRLLQVWKPIFSAIEKKTEIKVQYVGSKSIAEFERKLLSGQLDIAYMNPYHFKVANEKLGFIPLLKDESRRLRGVLVAASNGQINNVNDLDGKVVAFPAPNALGASLLMRYELEELFGVKVIPKFVKTHDSVYLNVILDEASAGGGVLKTYNSQKDRVKKSLKIIHETKDLAPHPVAILPGVPTNIRNNVVRILLQFASTPEGQKLFEKIPMKKVGVAKLMDYNPLKTMQLERFYVSPE